MKLRLLLLVTGILLALELSGCAQFMGRLRRDLDDGAQDGVYQGVPTADPTTGGRWTEKGFLSEDMGEQGEPEPMYYNRLGHSERAPASVGGDPAAPISSSWVTPEQLEKNRRDAQRGLNAVDAVNTAMTPNLAPPVKRQYKNGARATRDDFIDQSTSEGSLWASDGQTNYYFTKNKVRSVGDIVTLTIDEAVVRDIAIEAKRNLSDKEREFELGLIQAKIRADALAAYVPEPDPYATPSDTASSSQAAPARAPAATPAATPTPAPAPQEIAGATAVPGGSGTAEVPVQAVLPEGVTLSKDKNYYITPSGKEVDFRKATIAEIDMTKKLEIKAGETVMSEIIERYPNGNYKIRGIKRVPYRNGPPKLVSIVGIVKGTDITEEDTTTSGKLYEYRVDVIQ